MVLVDSHGISRVPRYSGTCRESADCRLRGSHPLWPIVPDRSTNLLIGNSPALNRTGPTTPPCKHDGLGCSAFARRYWRNHYCFLFLRVLRWFTSPGWLRHPMNSGDALEDYPRGVAPFGNLRVKACLRLTGAYRCLTRPSSPSCAKASTVRP